MKKIYLLPLLLLISSCTITTENSKEISKDENDKFFDELEALKKDENISLLIKDDLKSKLFVDAFRNRRELEKNGLFKVREIDISDTSLISHISEEEISNSASLFKNNSEEKKR